MLNIDLVVAVLYINLGFNKRFVGATLHTKLVLSTEVNLGNSTCLISAKGKDQLEQYFMLN